MEAERLETERVRREQAAAAGNSEAEKEELRKQVNESLEKVRAEEAARLDKPRQELMREQAEIAARGTSAPLTGPIEPLSVFTFRTFQNSLAEIAEEPDLASTITGAAKLFVNNIVEYHTGVFTRQELNEEPQRMADFRPGHWGGIMTILLKSPRYETIPDLKAWRKLRRMVTVLMGTRTIGEAVLPPVAPRDLLATSAFAVGQDLQERSPGKARDDDVEAAEEQMGRFADQMYQKMMNRGGPVFREDEYLARSRVTEWNKEENSGRFYQLMAKVPTYDEMSQPKLRRRVDWLIELADAYAGTSFASAADRTHLSLADFYYASERLTNRIATHMSGNSSDFKQACLAVGLFAKGSYEWLHSYTVNANTDTEDDRLAAERINSWQLNKKILEPYEKVAAWTGPRDGVSAEALRRLKEYANTFAGPEAKVKETEATEEEEENGEDEETKETEETEKPQETQKTQETQETEETEETEEIQKTQKTQETKENQITTNLQIPHGLVTKDMYQGYIDVLTAFDPPESSNGVQKEFLGLAKYLLRYCNERHQELIQLNLDFETPDMARLRQGVLYGKPESFKNIFEGLKWFMEGNERAGFKNLLTLLTELGVYGPIPEYVECIPEYKKVYYGPEEPPARSTIFSMLSGVGSSVRDTVTIPSKLYQDYRKRVNEEERRVGTEKYSADQAAKRRQWGRAQQEVSNNETARLARLEEAIRVRATPSTVNDAELIARNRIATQEVIDLDTKSGIITLETFKRYLDIIKSVRSIGPSLNKDIDDLGEECTQVWVPTLEHFIKELEVRNMTVERPDMARRRREGLVGSTGYPLMEARMREPSLINRTGWETVCAVVMALGFDDGSVPPPELKRRREDDEGIVERAAKRAKGVVDYTANNCTTS